MRRLLERPHDCAGRVLGLQRHVHGFCAKNAVSVIPGEPTSVEDAEQLAKEDPYQFQWWSLGLVGARPIEQKKGADKGIDGRIFFHDESGGKTKQIVLSVKAGKLQAQHLRDLRGVIEREEAEIGVLISFQAPTKPMRDEAASSGFYMSPGWGSSHQRLQILTVAQLLDGKELDYPHMTGSRFKRAPRHVPEAPRPDSLFDLPEADET